MTAEEWVADGEVELLVVEQRGHVEREEELPGQGRAGKKEARRSHSRTWRLGGSGRRRLRIVVGGSSGVWFFFFFF